MTTTASRDFGGSWIWLYPATYVLHSIEEVWAGDGYAAWISEVSGSPLDQVSLIVIHALLIVAISGIVATVRKMGRCFWVIVMFAVVFVGNALLHAVLSWVTQSYSPGAVTGFLLWLPLGAATLWAARTNVSPSDLAWGVSLGLIATSIISFLATSPEWIPQR